MKLPVLAICFLLLPISGSPQTDKPVSLPIEREPHHSLTFENDRVRVFRLHLQPNEVTKTHRHSSFYAYFSLQPATISNEVAGHAPVVTQLEQLELRTSKGGFNVAERNKSAGPIDVFVVQPIKSAGDGFAAPLAIPMHEVGIVEQYTGPTMRAYSLAIASSGRLEEHTEAYDSLVIAVADSNLHESGPGGRSEDWKMKTGDTRWIPRGTTHSVMNLGSSPAALIVIELN